MIRVVIHAYIRSTASIFYALDVIDILYFVYQNFCTNKIIS